MNDTHAAVDLIPKDVVICDWHYERPAPSSAFFAMKGLSVVSCPWKDPAISVAQVKAMRSFRASSPPEMRDRFLGIVQTVWSGSGSFLDQFYHRSSGRDPARSESRCFEAMFEEISNPK